MARIPLLMFICLLLTDGVAQQLLVGDIPVRLGATEQETVDWFRAKGYALDHHLNQDTEFNAHTFAVHNKNQHLLGVIGFQDGKLNYASRFFNDELSSNQSATSLAEIVFEQLRQLKDDDVLKHCVVDAKEVPFEGTLTTRGGMSRKITFVCETKTMAVFISPAGKVSLQVDLQ